MAHNPDNDPSVFQEPHLRPDDPARARCSRCGYDLRATLASRCPECGKPPFEPPNAEDAVDHSVWDEPTLAREIVGPPPKDAITYAAWLTERRASTSTLETWCMTGGLAVAAGPLAILGAVMSGGQTLIGVLIIVVFAPVVEEVMKVAAATWTIERRPFWFSSSAQVLICCLCGGLVFAVIENVIYLRFYIPDPTPHIVAWRWTVCVALHAGCSSIAGLGLARIWRRTMKEKARPELGAGFSYLLTAILVHASYNALAVLFEKVLFVAP